MFTQSNPPSAFCFTNKILLAIVVDNQLSKKSQGSDHDSIMPTRLEKSNLKCHEFSHAMSAHLKSSRRELVGIKEWHSAFGQF